MTKRASCAIPQCPNSSEKTAGPNVTYHKLPSKEKMRRRWLRAIECAYPQFTVDAALPTPRLCSDHFEDGDLLYKNGKVILSPDVIPSVFAPNIVPKKEKIDVKPRHHARRAASKEALKQMQMLLEDDDDVAEVPDDDDYVYAGDVKEEEEPLAQTVAAAPKKKYKLTHRKSADGNDREVLVLKTIPTPNITNHNVENNLELECWVEELEPCQKERNQRLQDEQKAVQDKLDELLKECKGEIVFKGDLTTVIEVEEHVQKTIQAVQASQNQPPIVLNSSVATPAYHLVVDCRQLGTAGKQPKIQAQSSPACSPTPAGRGRPPKLKKLTVVAPPATPTTTPVVTRSILASQGAKQVLKRAVPLPVITGPPATRSRGNATGSPNARPTENNVEGGLSAGTTVKPKAIVDLTSDDGRPLPDSREVSFNKLQGKTFPSLVVVARPHLRVVNVNADRTKLDSKVKGVLMYPPTKFTEWLIQQGLVKSEQKCSVHFSNQLKLGMYSDVTKFPYSGGYVWISECCPQRFVSVFSGSLFEGSPHQPLVILKLLYHWICQTNIQNVTQWVKVDNLYVKGMYTWLRSICSVALQTHLRQLGGPQTKVEVGVISLGTTSQDGNSRQVKVEVLGVLETTSKLVRLRAIEPQTEGERNYKKRFSKILEPLEGWVHSDSTIVTDLTVDKATLMQMGFANVIQTTSVDVNNSNRTIMEYLRRIVPRMFQNTLSLLSRQIIQQFLDELVWREWFGTTSMEAFDNLISHLAEQTRHESSQNLVVRLNKVALNPFKNWAITPSGGTPAPPNGVSLTINQQSKTLETYGKKRKRKESEAPTKITSPSQQEMNRPPKSTSPDVPEQMVPLESYYYGTIDHYPPKTNVKLNLKCPICKEIYNNNIVLMGHLFKHAHNVSKDLQMCKYCLTSVATANDLLKHIASAHPSETKHENGFICLICEAQYMNPFVLGKHMSKEHCPSELPYQCGTCGYRCSNHKQAIDHFYKQHNNGPTIQCPFCLKSTTVFSSSRNIAQNMHFFIQHLQKHQRKQLAKRCGKCNSWFIQKDLLKDHLIKMHTSQRGKTGLVPWVAPRNGVMVPKSKMDKYPCDAEGINFATLFYNVGKGLKCKECEGLMDNPKHFPSFESCQNPNCQYSTCCSSAMQEHNAKCNKNASLTLPEEKLPYEMFCICGFSSQDGNQMAKHLATCEKKSAYSSLQEAKNASVTHSMLDVLGLVRKPEEGDKKSKKLPTEDHEPESAAKKFKDAEKSEEVIELIDEDSKPAEVAVGNEIEDVKIDEDNEKSLKSPETVFADTENENVSKNNKEPEETPILRVTEEDTAAPSEHEKVEKSLISNENIEQSPTLINEEEAVPSKNEENTLLNVNEAPLVAEESLKVEDNIAMEIVEKAAEDASVEAASMLPEKNSMEIAKSPLLTDELGVPPKSEPEIDKVECDSGVEKMECEDSVAS
ncbi:uncharacterized protein row isoform X3 [Euwallacea similis]|uniref:uncharacterized protein row isoform X3 n=1 Tax=Euwallacea similis TaxID=1736056 RepID=UPI00344E1DFA